MNELKAAWDMPLRHEDPLVDEERRLLAVAQLVRDSPPSTPLPHIISDEDMMEACMLNAASLCFGFTVTEISVVTPEIATIAAALFQERMTKRRAAAIGAGRVERR